MRLFRADLGVGFEPGAEGERRGAGAGAGGGQVIGVGDVGLGEGIEFRLRLGAGSADGDPAAVGQLGEDELLGRHALSFGVEHLVALVVGDAEDLGAVDDGGRGLAPGGDDTTDACGALGAFERKVQQVLVVRAVAEMQDVERVEQRATA